MSKLTSLRRFLVLQALLLWQGGFLFYAGFVVPIGTDIHGRFGQGRVTDRVAFTLNIIGTISLVILAWELVCEKGNGLHRVRWVVWSIWILTQSVLVGLHRLLGNKMDVDSVKGDFNDYQDFLFWHGVYLWVWAAQWLLGVVYLVFTIRDWFGNSRRDSNV